MSTPTRIASTDPIVIVDHHHYSGTNQYIEGFCSLDATDDQIRSAVGRTERSMSSLPHVQRRDPLPVIKARDLDDQPKKLSRGLIAFRVTVYTND